MSIGSAQCKIKSHRRGAKNAEEKIFFLAAERTARKKPLHLGGGAAKAKTNRTNHCCKGPCDRLFLICLYLHPVSAGPLNGESKEKNIFAHFAPR
jgi:hypothetical protein